MSTTPQSVVKYRVRDVDLGGFHTLVVLHGTGQSSALVPLANAVLLSNDLGWALSTEGGIRGHPKYVRVEALQQLIELAVVCRLQEALKAKLCDEGSMLQAWIGYKEIIGLLPKCLSVNPAFTSCDTFAEDNVVEHLFVFLGHYLYHGLVVDPKEDHDIARAMKSKTYNEIVNMLPSEVENNTALKKFLESAKNGLTASGFTEEGTSAPFFEGQVKALYHCKSYTLTIKFKDLENYDKEIARYVCDNMTRICDRLKECACTFLLEHNEFKTNPEEVVQKTTIEISDFPVPNRHLTIDDRDYYPKISKPRCYYTTG